jgi:hypothetical protein
LIKKNSKNIETREGRHKKMEVESVTISSGLDAESAYGSILGIIMGVATWAGGAILIWGLVMFGLAIKNDEPESKQKALMCTFGGLVLVCLRTILQTAGIIGG